MNLEGQNLESLRKMIRQIQEENQELKELLKKSNITFNDSKEEMINENMYVSRIRILLIYLHRTFSFCFKVEEMCMH